ncbi:MAG: hypothetical protein ACE5EX_01415 [Phycisphaerae bacterium]
MDFVRRQLFFIICGVVGAGAVALGVTGLKGMPKVGEEMKKAQDLYNQLQRVDPVNRAVLSAAEKRIDSLVEDRRRVFEKARELYGYEPLVPDALPAGDPNARTEFRKAYAVAMDKLMASLNYGGPATPLEIAMWRDRIEDEEAQQQELGLDAGVEPSAPPPEGPPKTPAGVLTRDGARKNPQARADMARAQQIYCYATHFNERSAETIVPSLFFAEEMIDTGLLEVPELGPIWFAQLEYWIQKDVVDAIVAVNDAAADRLRKEGGKPWVGNLPIKEFVSIRVSDYLSAEGGFRPGDPPGGREAAEPPASSDGVFTGTNLTDWYEVVQFSVKLIMDQRDIPRLIARLSKHSPHTLLRVAYTTVEPNRAMVGRIYGSGPVVSVVMDFETILIGEIFRPLMPDVVCEDYAIPCPVREDGGEG